MTRNGKDEKIEKMERRFNELAERSQQEQAQGLLVGVTPEIGICWTHSEMRLTFSRMITPEERELLGRLMSYAIKGYHDAVNARASPRAETICESAQPAPSTSESPTPSADLSVNLPIAGDRASIPDTHCAYCRKSMAGGYFCTTQNCPARGINQYPQGAGLVRDRLDRQREADENRGDDSQPNEPEDVIATAIRNLRARGFDPKLEPVRDEHGYYIGLTRKDT